MRHPQAAVEARGSLGVHEQETLTQCGMSVGLVLTGHYGNLQPAHQPSILLAVVAKTNEPRNVVAMQRLPVRLLTMLCCRLPNPMARYKRHLMQASISQYKADRDICCVMHHTHHAKIQAGLNVLRDDRCVAALLAIVNW